MSDPFRENATVENQKPFPLEKIFTVSAKNYCKFADKNIKDYDLVAVHARLLSRYDLGNYPDIRIELAKEVPPNTEIVTDYRAAIAMNNFGVVQYADATALVPKLYEDEFEDDYGSD